jgi:hypothetical protein
MNHLVFLDAQAGELEKILSGVKTMIIKAYDPAQPIAYPVSPNDSLYFLRNKDCCVVRVKATVIRVLPLVNVPVDHIPQTLKEMQSRLQLTEDQYNHWSTKGQALLIEFGAAQKIDVFQVALDKNTDRSDWISFDNFGLIN